MTCSIDKLVAKIASKFHDCPEDELESIEHEIAELLVEHGFLKKETVKMNIPSVSYGKYDTSSEAIEYKVYILANEA